MKLYINNGAVKALENDIPKHATRYLPKQYMAKDS